MTSGMYISTNVASCDVRCEAVTIAAVPRTKARTYTFFHSASASSATQITLCQLFRACFWNASFWYHPKIQIQAPSHPFLFKIKKAWDSWIIIYALKERLGLIVTNHFYVGFLGARLPTVERCKITSVFETQFNSKKQLKTIQKCLYGNQYRSVITSKEVKKW